MAEFRVLTYETTTNLVEYRVSGLKKQDVDAAWTLVKTFQEDHPQVRMVATQSRDYEPITLCRVEEVDATNDQ